MIQKIVSPIFLPNKLIITTNSVARFLLSKVFREQIERINHAKSLEYKEKFFS